MRRLIPILLLLFLLSPASFADDAGTQSATTEADPKQAGGARPTGAEMGGRASPDRDPKQAGGAQRPTGAEMGGRASPDRDPKQAGGAQRPTGAEMGGRALPDRDPRAEWEPITGREPPKISSSRLVVGSYVAFFVLMLGYVVIIARRQAQMSREIASLRQRLDQMDEIESTNRSK